MVTNVEFQSNARINAGAFPNEFEADSVGILTQFGWDQATANVDRNTKPWLVSSLLELIGDDRRRCEVGC